MLIEVESRIWMARRRRVLLLALVLGACSGNGAADTTTTSVAAPLTTTTVPQAAATTTTAPTTTTSVDVGPTPALTTDDTVTTAGLGEVRIGMTVDEAQEAAGRVMLDEASDMDSSCFYVRPEGLEGVGFMVIDETIARVDVSTGPISTRSGARIGMTEQQIKDMFPGQIEVEPHEYSDDGHYLIFVPRDAEIAAYRVVFETDGTVVTQYRAGLVPAVLFVEGCS